MSYKIAPCINADNRIDDLSDLAIRLLLCQPTEEASEIAEELKLMNDRRKNLCAEADDLAHRVISAFKMEKNFPLVVNLGTDCSAGACSCRAVRVEQFKMDLTIKIAKFCPF